MSPSVSTAQTAASQLASLSDLPTELLLKIRGRIPHHDIVTHTALRLTCRAMFRVYNDRKDDTDDEQTLAWKRENGVWWAEACREVRVGRPLFMKHRTWSQIAAAFAKHYQVCPRNYLRGYTSCSTNDWERSLYTLRPTLTLQEARRDELHEQLRSGCCGRADRATELLWMQGAHPDISAPSSAFHGVYGPALKTLDIDVFLGDGVAKELPKFPHAKGDIDKRVQHGPSWCRFATIFPVTHMELSIFGMKHSVVNPDGVTQWDVFEGVRQFILGASSFSVRKFLENIETYERNGENCHEVAGDCRYIAELLKAKDTSFITKWAYKILCSPAGVEEILLETASAFLAYPNMPLWDWLLETGVGMFTSRRYSVDDILDLIAKHWPNARNKYWYRTMRQFASPQGYADRLRFHGIVQMKDQYSNVYMNTMWACPIKARPRLDRLQETDTGRYRYITAQ